MKATQHELMPALEQYDVRVSSVVEIPAGFNMHYQVATAQGPMHLVIFRPQPGKPPRDLEFRMRAHLSAAGFEALAEAVPTRFGRPFARTRLGTVALLDWVEGEVHTPSAGWPAQRVCGAARTLASFHRALADFRPASPPVASLSSLYLSAGDWLARAPRLADDFHEWSEPSDALRDAIARRLDELHALFDRDAHAGAIEDGTAMVHGDYRPANLVVKHDRIAGVLDFDAAFWESRVYDLAYACFQFDDDKQIEPLRRRTPAIAFARCYARAWPLSEAERRLFPFFLRQVVLKRLLSGRNAGPRLALLDQLDAGLESELTRAVA